LNDFLRELSVAHICYPYTPCPEKKWNQQCFKHKFDKNKYIVVIFARNVAKVMRNQTNTTNIRMQLNNVTTLPCELTIVTY